MTVKRIVANIASRTGAAKGSMETSWHDGRGWIRRIVTGATAAAHDAASEHCQRRRSGTAVPDLLHRESTSRDVHDCVMTSGIALAYGPVREARGVPPFYVRDPLGRC